MQAKNESKTYSDIDINVTGITLLSREEYLNLKSNIKPINWWWWLRSPGNYSDYESYIIIDDNIYLNHAYFTNGSVRPVLIYKSNNVHIKDVICIANHSWTVISDRYILCNEELCRMAFRRDYKSDNANSYELSDIKKYLDDWFKENIIR